MSCRKIASKRFYTTLVFYNSLDNLIGRNAEKNKQKITFFLFGARAEWMAMRSSPLYEVNCLPNSDTQYTQTTDLFENSQYK